MSKAYKQLGKVADGRIRKNWPRAPPFVGPFATLHSGCKGFENLFEPNMDPDRFKYVPFQEFVRVSCYQNAMLQCLLHVPEFIRYLSREERCKNESCHATDKKLLCLCVYCALGDLARHYWTSTNAEFRQEKIRAFREAVHRHVIWPKEDDDDSSDDEDEIPDPTPEDPNNASYRLLGPGEQRDTHEYFSALAHMLHFINEHRIDRLRPSDAMYVKNVAIDRLFEVKLKRQWTCQSCNGATRRRGADWGLHVSILRRERRDDPIKRLSEHIREHFRPDNIAKRCNSAKCGGRRSAEREFISSGPEILIFQANRTDYDKDRGVPYKNTDRVPLDKYLDLSEHTTPTIGAEPKMALRYKLFGVVSHAGANPTSGHYIATVRCRNGVDFAQISDTVITDVAVDRASPTLNIDDAVSQSYVLVYQKIGGEMVRRI